MKFRLFISLFILFLIINKYSKNNKKHVIDFNIHKENSYLIYRGTNTKEGFLAKKFNLRDTINSHVVFLLYDKSNGWNVYNISNYKDPVLDLKKISLTTFLSEVNEVTSASFWKIKNIDKLKLVEILERQQTKNIKFNISFNLEATNEFYCSQFVSKILREIDSIKFNYKPVSKEIKGIYKTYFRKDTLTYYPVDLFQSDKKNIIKTDELDYAY